MSVALSLLCLLSVRQSSEPNPSRWLAVKCVISNHTLHDPQARVRGSGPTYKQGAKPIIEDGKFQHAETLQILTGGMAGVLSLRLLSTFAMSSVEICIGFVCWRSHIYSGSLHKKLSPGLKSACHKPAVMRV